MPQDKCDQPFAASSKDSVGVKTAGELQTRPSPEAGPLLALVHDVNLGRGPGLPGSQLDPNPRASHCRSLESYGAALK
jgi:hypothetical protein